MWKERERDTLGFRSTRYFVPVIIAIVIIGVGVAAFFLYESYGVQPGTSTTISCNNIPKAPSSSSGDANATQEGPVAHFLIIDADPGSNFEGMNGSAYHLSVPWPVMAVRQNQTVVIQVLNCASSEPHGFAISHYLNGGVTLRQGESTTVTFVANQKGTFRVYCSIFCVIHQDMQNGELIVT